MELKLCPAVPEAVRAAALSWSKRSQSNAPGNRAILTVTDPKMDRIWKNLKRYKPVAGAEEFLRENFDVIFFLIGIQEMKIDEKAYAAFFLTCLKIASQDDAVTTEKEHSIRIGRYKMAAEIIKEARFDGYEVDKDFNEILSTALIYSERYIIRRAIALSQEGDPGRRFSSAGDYSVLKSAARELTNVTMNLFGRPLDGIIAEFENAIFAPDQPIAGVDTIKWRLEAAARGKAAPAIKSGKNKNGSEKISSLTSSGRRGFNPSRQLLAFASNHERLNEQSE